MQTSPVPLRSRAFGDDQPSYGPGVPETTPELIASSATGSQYSCTSDDDSDKVTLLTPQFLPANDTVAAPPDFDLLFGEDSLQDVDDSVKKLPAPSLLDSDPKPRRLARSQIKSKYSRERQEQEETRGRSRFPRLLWQSSLCDEQIDVLDDYYRRVTGDALPSWPSNLQPHELPATAAAFDRDLLRAGL